MAIYLLNMFLLILGYVVWGQLKDEKKLKKCFCIQATVQWILVSGLRDVSVGADTGRYRIMFENVKLKTWGEIISECYLHFKGVIESKDPGYDFFQKFIQIFVEDYQIYLLIVAIIFTVPMGCWIYKYSTNVLLSFMIFSCLFYSFFAITGIRQTIVTALGVFIGYELLQNKKYIAYYFLLLCLYPIHKSVLALAIFPLIFKKGITKKYLLFSFVAIMFCWIFKDSWMNFLAGILEYDQYAEYYEGAGAVNFSVLFMLVLCVAILFRKKILKKYPETIAYYNGMIIAACLLPLTFINQSAMRVVQYYSIYLILILPNIVNIFNKRDKKIVMLVGVASLMFLFVRNNPYYIFFWQ